MLMYFMLCVLTNSRVFVFRVQNWSHTSLISKLKGLAEIRKLADFTFGPVLTVSVYRHCWLISEIANIYLSL